MAGVDDIIGRWVKKVEKTGELERSELFGKPFELDPAYERTPDDVRMAHKVLKNAGYVPPGGRGHASHCGAARAAANC